MKCRISFYVIRRIEIKTANAVKIIITVYFTIYNQRTPSPSKKRKERETAVIYKSSPIFNSQKEDAIET